MCIRDSGIVGPRTIAAVQAYQQSIGWVPDGYVSARVLERLRSSERVSE